MTEFVSSPRRATVVIALLLGVIVMLATALTVTATRDPFDNRKGAPPSTVVVVLDQQAIERGVPALSAAQRQQALERIARQPDLPLDVRGLTGQGASSAVWTDSHGGLIGAVVTLRLNRPMEIEGQWLGLNYDPEEQSTPPYQSVPYQARFGNVTAVTVFVDLTRGEVVGIAPDSDSQVVGEPAVPAGIASPSRPRD